MAFLVSANEQLQNLPTDIRILLIGKTGVGKSSTGNSILGRNGFRVSFDVGTETRKCHSEMSRVNDCTITAVDTPGLCGTVLDDDGVSCNDVMESLQEIFGSFKPNQGFDGIVLVLQLGARMTREESGVIDQYRNMLGGGVLWRHGVIVFTNGDSFVGRTKGRIRFDQWCREQRGDLKTYLEECQYRCVLFNNVTEDIDVLKGQRDNLIKLVKEQRASHGQYTAEDFEKAKDAWQVKKSKKEERERYDEICIGIGRLAQEINAFVKRGNGDEKNIHTLIGKIDDLKSLVDSFAGDKKEKDKFYAQINSFYNQVSPDTHKRAKGSLGGIICFVLGAVGCCLIFGNQAFSGFAYVVKLIMSGTVYAVKNPIQTIKLPFEILKRHLPG